jgi:hypothetical protein
MDQVVLASVIPLLHARSDAGMGKVDMIRDAWGIGELIVLVQDLCVVRIEACKVD